MAFPKSADCTATSDAQPDVSGRRSGTRLEVRSARNAPPPSPVSYSFPHPLGIGSVRRRFWRRQVQRLATGVAVTEADAAWDGAAAVNAIAAQLVPAADIHWSTPCGNRCRNRLQPSRVLTASRRASASSEELNAALDTRDRTQEPAVCSANSVLPVAYRASIVVRSGPPRPAARRASPGLTLRPVGVRPANLRPPAIVVGCGCALASHAAAHERPTPPGLSTLGA